MEGLIIFLLALNAVVGLLVLLVVIMFYRQWKRPANPLLSQEALPDSITPLLQAAVKPLSSVEKKYLILFTEGKSTEEIAGSMHVEPATVYTMKYRLRKKFPADYSLPF